MTRREKIERGREAKRLLEDATLAGAFTEIDRQMTERWRRSPVGAVEEREAAYRILLALSELKAQLGAIIATGRLAEAEETSQQP